MHTAVTALVVVVLVVLTPAVHSSEHACGVQPTAPGENTDTSVALLQVLVFVAIRAAVLLLFPSGQPVLCGTWGEGLLASCCAPACRSPTTTTTTSSFSSPRADDNDDGEGEGVTTTPVRPPLRVPAILGDTETAAGAVLLSEPSTASPERGGVPVLPLLTPSPCVVCFCASVCCVCCNVAGTGEAPLYGSCACVTTAPVGGMLLVGVLDADDTPLVRGACCGGWGREAPLRLDAAPSAVVVAVAVWALASLTCRKSRVSVASSCAAGRERERVYVCVWKGGKEIVRVYCGYLCGWGPDAAPG